MRILATNPDTIGDVVLRQPMYHALLKAGHELMLVVRPLLGPLISAIAPGARVLACGANLYNPRLQIDSPDLDDVVEAARGFNPDLILIAPFQWTVLEERLALSLPGVRLAAMSGRRYADPGFGPVPESSLAPATRVDVAEDTPELRKNELLAGAVLGCAARLPDPSLSPTPDQLRAAQSHLARLGLKPGGYWVACVGDNEHTRIRNWHPGRWAEALSEWAGKGKRFLFVGHDSEIGTSQDIIEAMGERSAEASLWSGDGEGDLDVLLGLIAHSAGYVGRDTGPMHLAAAMGKPVLAVFGGGTWPRFLPAASPSVSLALGVPCVGCGWVCQLQDSYCIKEIGLDDVLKGMQDLDEGRVKTRDVRLLDPGRELLVRIGREGAARARERMVNLSVTRRDLMEQNDALTAVLERSVKRASEADRLAGELDSLRAEMERRESLLRRKLAAAENLWRAREADMRQRISEMEAAEAIAHQRAAAADARAQEQVAAVRAESRAHLDEITHLRDELVRARAEAADAELRTRRLQADQATLTALTRQQDEEIATFRQRLHELMASRWRKYGQRMRLCMTLPWEREMSNGHH